MHIFIMTIAFEFHNIYSIWVNSSFLYTRAEANFIFQRKMSASSTTAAGESGGINKMPLKKPQEIEAIVR